MGVKTPPVLRNRLIYRQYPVAEQLQQLFEPLLQCVSVSRATRTQTLDSLPYFADNQDAEEKLVVAKAAIPCGYTRIAMSALVNLRNAERALIELSTSCGYNMLWFHVDIRAPRWRNAHYASVSGGG